jgi:hypothetical protein
LTPGAMARRKKRLSLAAGRIELRRSLTAKPSAPITRTPLHVHHGDNPNEIGLREKNDIVHRPAILRARASDSSSGTPLTVPDSISATRLAISACQAVAADGSTQPCRAAMMRSINSATTSPGISRVSSTI